MNDPRPLNIPVIFGTSTPMTHHADKVIPAASSEGEVVMAAARACAGSGAQQATLAPAPASELP
jgi:hypothetical protein